MLKKLTLLLAGVVLALAVPAAAQAGKTFYWISHGSPADPVWTYFLAGAKQWAADTGNSVNTSFHHGQAATLAQAQVTNRTVDYLTASKAKVKAIIGLGDMVTGSIKRVFDQAGIKAGQIPVVGWGNSLDTTQEVPNGYVNAAQWQDPQAT